MRVDLGPHTHFQLLERGLLSLDDLVNRFLSPHAPITFPRIPPCTTHDATEPSDPPLDSLLRSRDPEANSADGLVLLAKKVVRYGLIFLGASAEMVAVEFG